MLERQVIYAIQNRLNTWGMLSSHNAVSVP